MSDLLSFIEFNQYNLPLILQFFGIYLALLWLAVVAWVLRDITTRTNNLLVVVITALFVLVGTLPALVLYLLIRPEKTISETMNQQLFHASVFDKDVTSCQHCNALVRAEYKFCPNCSTQLQVHCKSCDYIVNPTWNYCINCKQSLMPDPWYVRATNRIKHAIDYANNQLTGLSETTTVTLPTKAQTLSRFKPSFNRVKLPQIKLNIPELSRLYTKSQPSVIRPAVIKTIAMEHKAEIASVSQPITIITGDKDKETSEKNLIAEKSKTVTKKRGRGRPPGQPDHKPRKKRADAGRKRGSYKK